MAWSEAKGQYDDTLYGAEPRAKFLVSEPSRQHCHRYDTATLQKEPFLMERGWYLGLLSMVGYIYLELGNPISSYSGNVDAEPAFCLPTKESDLWFRIFWTKSVQL